MKALMSPTIFLALIVLVQLGSNPMPVQADHCNDGGWTLADLANEERTLEANKARVPPARYTDLKSQIAAFRACINSHQQQPQQQRVPAQQQEQQRLAEQQRREAAEQQRLAEQQRHEAAEQQRLYEERQREEQQRLEEELRRQAAELQRLVQEGFIGNNAQLFPQGNRPTKSGHVAFTPPRTATGERGQLRRWDDKQWRNVADGEEVPLDQGIQIGPRSTTVVRDEHGGIFRIENRGDSDGEFVFGRWARPGDLKLPAERKFLEELKESEERRLKQQQDQRENSALAYFAKKRAEEQAKSDVPLWLKLVGSIEVSVSQETIKDLVVTATKAAVATTQAPIPTPDPQAALEASIRVYTQHAEDASKRVLDYSTKLYENTVLRLRDNGPIEVGTGKVEQSVPASRRLGTAGKSSGDPELDKQLLKLLGVETPGDVGVYPANTVFSVEYSSGGGRQSTVVTVTEGSVLVRDLVTGEERTLETRSSLTIEKEGGLEEVPAPAGTLGFLQGPAIAAIVAGLAVLAAGALFVVWRRRSA